MAQAFRQQVGAALSFLGRVIGGTPAPVEEKPPLPAAEWARLSALEWETAESTSGVVSILDPCEPDEATEMRALMAELAEIKGASLRPEAPLPPGIVAELVVSTVGAPGTRRHRLTTTSTVIGRGDDVQLRVADTKISRRHASIEFKGGEFRIRDEKSANGTVLNGSRVLEYALRHGDEVVVGDTKLRFRCLRMA